MYLNKLKEKILKTDSKTVHDLIIIFIIGLIILIGASVFVKPQPTNKNNDKQMVIKQDINNDYAKEVENNLKNVLSKIHGVGKVDVMITLNTDEEVVAATDSVQSETSTNEKDNNGGTRVTTQTETNNKIVTSQTTTGQNQPIILKKVMPEIRGVIVVAEGADNPNIQYQLLSAVQTALGIPAYKVKVISSN
ncbi:stage III sporulation protein AG [Aceticella autotrophica]|uniref:Stage III sporulation protein AG n=1 Tax=Aceticella autotrophica TaxID=2755338 RepID=A0A974Y480_9THEO|nr:stage III sporulation protein AG [Aceticella autotrophica]QSZ26512.1 stage III sporulation protein AG [Aceticella autotrophica]